MRLLFLIGILFSLKQQAQDKLFFHNGSTETGLVTFIARHIVYFKKTDTSLTRQINKSELILIEKENGTKYLFAAETPKETVKHVSDEKTIKRNLLGVQPFGIFFGRGSFMYERLTKNGKIGFAFPLSLTFDPVGSIYKQRKDSLRNNIPRHAGISFISGADVNFYLGKSQRAQFFIGPRLRFGNNLFFENIEAYTLQTQVGWKFGNPQGAFVQHLSIGFGFVRIISSSFSRANPRESYGWYSFNYRLGIKW
jgi:hypothetical protein